MIKTSKIFLASSSELKDDRKEFEIYIYRKIKIGLEEVHLLISLFGRIF